jgi:apolipoprotein N-acyltransferase
MIKPHKRLLTGVLTAPISFWFSFLIVAFGQPARAGWLGAVAAFCGFALFFSSLRPSLSRRQRLLCATLWFAAVQMVQLSWMTSIEFQGYYILFVYVFLALSMGCQFGLLALFIPLEGKISLIKILSCAGLWTLMEWSRLFFFCGFSWNPIGLALTHFSLSLQFASVFGVFGLSFWVMLTNLLALNVWRNKRPSTKSGFVDFRDYFGRFSILLLGGNIRKLILPPNKRIENRPKEFENRLKLNLWTVFKNRKGNVIGWLALMIFPYFYGAGQLAYHLPKSENAKRTVDAALVQTSLLPSEKNPCPGRMREFISPLVQWERIVKGLKPYGMLGWDMIVFPEVVVPMQSDIAFFPFESVREILVRELGPGVERAFPKSSYPFAQEQNFIGGRVLCVSNLFWCQTLANYFRAQVIVGLDHVDKGVKKNFNSAFYLKPFEGSFERYDKQVLLPLAEYLPFNFLKPLAKAYGIGDFFTPGQGAKVWGENFFFSPSICYEETFPEIMRDARLKGAQLFVNLTNDNYYPDSSLHEQHLYHARLRAVENGTPLLRSCNSGVTAAIDCFGRITARMDELKNDLHHERGVLNCRLNAYAFSTLYTFWGDKLLIELCAFLCLLDLVTSILKKIATCK